MMAMNTCEAAQRVTLTQNGHRYVGHWHGDIAVFGQGEAFRAGLGWLTYSEANDMIPRLCGEEAQS